MVEEHVGWVGLHCDFLLPCKGNSVRRDARHDLVHKLELHRLHNRLVFMLMRD